MGGGTVEKLEQAVQALLNTKYCFVYSTGRGAMTSLLSAIKALRSPDDTRNEVILPAYTCYSVASSAINAGLKIRLCDIDPNTLSYDPQKLRQIDFSHVLAIVSSSLYGLPNDMLMLEHLAQERGIVLIDDAAQSLNARVEGRPVGTFGHAGILSLDKGKNVTSMQGGLIVTNQADLADHLQKVSQQLPDLSFKSSLVEFIKVFIYTVFLNPYAYKIPANISFAGLGETRFETDVQVRRYPRFLSSLAVAQLKRIEQITQSRTAHGEYYERVLKGNDSLTKITQMKSAQPVYLRYPVLVNDPQLRADLLDRYREFGISVSYPKSLNNLPEIESSLVSREVCPGAERVAEQIVTLPTHAFVRETDMQIICEILNAL
jgi:dTDP-4-amino-4,6-dideoxygalactose transaminase